MTAVVRDPITLPRADYPPGRPGGRGSESPRRARAAQEGRPALGGAASLSLRGLLVPEQGSGPVPARVIAVFPAAVYLQARTAAEPRVLALVGNDAVRLPNAIVVAAPGRTLPSQGPSHGSPAGAFHGVREGAEAWIGDCQVEIGALRVRVRRWWDPRPALGPLATAGLARGVRALETTAAACAAQDRFGLSGHPDPALLAERCAAGDLAGAVEAAERIVGLGPGLTPTGDDVLAGLLVALRALGGAVPQGRAAVWLADWLGAAVTADADTRTTALAATLLHCAARGEASGEVAAVLRGVAGHEPPGPAVRRLLAAGHTSGADLTFGLLAGCRAALALTLAALRDQRASA